MGWCILLKAMDDDIMALKTCDLGKALRKFSNKNIVFAARMLHENGALPFGELRDATVLSTNDLNHALQEMKNADLIIKVDKKYCLTHYGALLLETLEAIMKELSNSPQDILLMPANQENAKILA
jgi:DNA-binding HxlR family transcriptional regulator